MKQFSGLTPRRALLFLCPGLGLTRGLGSDAIPTFLGIYKIFVHSKASLHYSQSPLYCLLHLLCSHYCNTVVRLMRNIRPPPDPPCICHTPYNIGSGNSV